MSWVQWQNDDGDQLGWRTWERDPQTGERSDTPTYWTKGVQTNLGGYQPYDSQGNRVVFSGSEIGQDGLQRVPLGDWGTGGYNPNERVMIDGQGYRQLGLTGDDLSKSIWGTRYINPTTGQKSSLEAGGNPFTDFVKYDPRYGNIIDERLAKAQSQWDRNDPLTTWGPALASLAMGGIAGAHALATGAPGLGQSLGQATGLLDAAPAAGATPGAGAAAPTAGGSSLGGAANVVTTPLSSANLAPMGTELPAVGAGGAGIAAPIRDIATTGINSGAGLPEVIDLGTQAGFGDTLRNVGLHQAVINSLGLGSAGPLSGIGQLLGLNGLSGRGGSGGSGSGDWPPWPRWMDRESGLGDFVNALLTGGAGKLSYDAAKDRLEFDRQRYEDEKAIRDADLEYYRNLRDNPDQFYARPDVQGAMDAGLRRLSVMGNPANIPTSLAKQAAYNYGLYDTALSRAGNRAGLGHPELMTGLGSMYGNSMMGPTSAITSTMGSLGSMLSPRNPYLQYWP